MLGPPPAGHVRFGVFEFDPVSGDLWKAGRRVRLQKQPQHVLRRLLSRPGQVVTRDELRRDLWPKDTFVDFDNGLNVAIRKLRAVLGDTAPSPRFIETERAHGYRFIAPVDEAPEAVVPPRPEIVTRQQPPAANPLTVATPRFLITASVLAVVAVVSAWPWRGSPGFIGSAPESPLPISLAVMPLAVASGSEDFLSVGIADGIITRLSNIRRFRVRPTSAVASYRGREVDAQAVGRRLGSQYVLVGSIRTTNDRVRVSVQLVRTTDGSSVWGHQYDVERRDLLGIEDAVAEEISSVLRIQLSAAERERAYRRYTRNAAAYERYLLGRARLRSLTILGAKQAIAEFEAASRLDPGYALAYAGMATAAAQLRVRFSAREGSAVWEARARDEAARALQLDPYLAEAHEALAAVHRFQEYDWDTVIRESRRALELNPSLDAPHLYLAVAFFHLGLFDEAASEVRAARELNPENRVEAMEILGAIHLFAGDGPAAIDYLSQVQDLSDSLIVRYLLGWTLYYEDDTLGAEALLDTMDDEEGPLSANARATLAAIRAAHGGRAEARSLASRVALDRDLIHHGAYGLGAAYAQLGDPASAVRWLSQAATTGFPCYPWFERDPLLDPVRDDVRFAAFMRALRRSWEDAGARYGAGGQYQ
jgi:TolB-like protein/DNA-binding winged helix-turn-helix (wHTH) protein